MPKENHEQVEAFLEELKILKSRRNHKSKGKTYEIFLHVVLEQAFLFIPSLGLEERVDKNTTYEQLFSSLGRKIDGAIKDPGSYKQQLLSQLL